MAAVSVAQAPPPPAPVTPAPAPSATEAAPPEPAPAQPPPPMGGAEVVGGFRAAEAARGPLEGRWRLRLGDGQPLYSFEISDSGGAPDARAAAPQAPQIEGAWRDLRHPDALDASGVLVVVKRDLGQLVILFYEGQPPQSVTVTLEPVSPAAWSGELVAGDARIKVVMTRD
jgi:hypothetical protein